MADISLLSPLRPLSASRLAAFRRCETLFLLDEEREETAAQLVGKAAHCLILEGRAEYERRFVAEGPINEKTGKPYGIDTKACQDWIAMHGKAVLGAQNATLVEAMERSVKGHVEAARLLDWSGSPEFWIEAKVAGLDCHGRLDFVTANLEIVDLKTCADLDSFESDARRHGYAHQLAFYRSLLAAKECVGELEIQCWIVAVEKAQPYRCGVWRIGQGVLGQAQAENFEAMQRLKLCWSLKDFRTGFEEVRELDFI